MAACATLSAAGRVDIRRCRLALSRTLHREWTGVVSATWRKLLCSVRHIDGHGFDKAGGRPTNLPIPLVRQ